MDYRLRQEVHRRSGNQCEVIEEFEDHETGLLISIRCSNRGSEIHHMLTKARGGRNLDALGETYHLIDLCGMHHRMCDGKAAYDGGLLIDGYVMTKNGMTVYNGTDEYLTRKYGGQRAQQTEQDDQGSKLPDHHENGAVAGTQRQPRIQS